MQGSLHFFLRGSAPTPRREKTRAAREAAGRGKPHVASAIQKKLGR
jgi:hypothetical protein